MDRVKRALKRRMEERGVSYTNAEDLIEDVLHDQTMEEYTTRYVKIYRSRRVRCARLEIIVSVIQQSMINMPFSMLHSSTPDLSPDSTNIVDHIILHTTDDPTSSLDDAENNIVQNGDNVQSTIKDDENEVCESKTEEAEAFTKEDELEGKKIDSKFDDIGK